MVTIVKYLFFPMYFLAICETVSAHTQVQEAYVAKTNSISDKLLRQVEDYLNKLKILRAEFTQIDRNGIEKKGYFLLLKRGNSTFLKMDYTNPPTNAMIVKNNKVISFDKELNEKSMFNSYSSPMSFLLEKRINLQKNVKILELSDGNDEVLITLCKKTGDTDAVVTIYFSKNPLKLQRWEIFPNAKYLGTNTSTNVILTKQDANPKISEKEFADYD